MMRKIGIASLLAVLIIIAYLRFSGDLVVRFGGLFWIPVSAKTFWLPNSMALAMHDPPPEAVSGPLEWNEIRHGFEVAELLVLVEGAEADRVLLARIDPEHYRFAVLNDPRGSKHLDDWVRQTGAALIVNGSYYSRAGIPATPVVSGGRLSGPSDYVSKHGAFIAAAGRAAIRDLTKEDWRTLFAGAEAGIVSYPLLLAPDGSTARAPRGSKWLANRSFIGEDQSGRVIIGTTKGAFFSLDRLADFLKASPLELTAVLNLDGGPVACQAIRLGSFERKSYGRWEMQVKDGKAKVLPPWPFGTAPMPLVLAAFSKE
jgi:hypothetical protein